MRTPRLFRAALIPWLCLPGTVLAQGKEVVENPAALCHHYEFFGGGSYSGARLVFKPAQLIGPRSATIHFLSDSGDCPRADNPGCVKSSYVLPGDRVIVSKTYRDWACSWYPPQRGRETVGWLPMGSLKIAEPDTHPPLEAWINEWTFNHNVLTISRGSKAGELQVEGNASWSGRAGMVHSGEIDARSRPERNTLALDHNDDAGDRDNCKMWLSLVGDFLVANDNSKCGGINVTFNGVYRKPKSER